MSGILTGTPIWVWPLFVLLVIIGLRARHARRVPIAMFYALPALGFSALAAVASLGAGPFVWLVFAVAYAAGAWGGFLVQRAWVLGREGRMVELAGENLTLSMMMLVFGANFVGGFLQAVAPQVYGSAAFCAVFAAVVALSSGSFAGRALRVWKVTGGGQQIG